MSLRNSIGIILFSFWASDCSCQSTKKHLDAIFFMNASILKIDDCACQFRAPDSAISMRSFSPSFGFVISIPKRLKIKTFVGFFQHVNTVTGINEQYPPKVSYSVIERHTKNILTELSLGIGFGQKKVQIIPYAGIAIIHRRLQHIDESINTYYYMPHPSVTFPDTAPDLITNNSIVSHYSWNTTALSIGVDCTIQVLPRLIAQISIQSIPLSQNENWNDGREKSSSIIQCGIALGLVLRR